MKTNTSIMRGGESNYSCPLVARVDITVEAGFAQSFNGEGDIPDLGFDEYSLMNLDFDFPVIEF